MPDYDILRQLQSNLPEQPRAAWNVAPSLSNTELTQQSSNGRYPIYYPGINNEDLYGSSQSGLDKWKSGAVGFAGNFTNTVLQGTLGLVNGVFQAANDGKLSSFYDNEFNNTLDTWNEQLANSNPNYYSDSEKELGAGQLFTNNFWADKIFKNLGFAAGAYVAGAGWSKLAQGTFKAIGTVSKAMGVEGGLPTMANAARNVELGLTSRNTAAIAEAESPLLQTAQQLNSTSTKLDVGKKVARAGMASFGEASIEAQQAKKTYKDSLIAKYQSTFGENPQGEALQKIDDEASKVGNTVFGANVALLTATNYIQFPKISNLLWGTSKAELAAAERGISRTVTSNLEGDALQAAQKTGNLTGTVTSTIAPTKGFSRYLKGATRIGGLLFSPSEAFEEGAQFVIPDAAQNYFDKARQGKESDVMIETLKSIKKAVTTKEGLESILIGGISGGLMENFNPFNSFAGVRGLERKETNRRTDAFVSAVNKTFAGNIINDMNDSLKRDQVLEGETSQAARNNDRLNYEDGRTDRILNYLLPRIQHGRFDLVKNDLQEYKDLATDPNKFQELQKSGLIDQNMSQEDYTRSIDIISAKADTVRAQFELLNTRYGATKNEDGQLKYQPQHLMGMAYVSSKIDDYNQRIPQLLAPFNAHAIDIQTTLDKVYDKTITNEDIEILGEQINNIKTENPEQKRLLAEQASDLVELTLRRERKIQEYEQLRGYPELWNISSNPTVDPTPEGQPSINQIDQALIEDDITDADKLTAQTVVFKEQNGQELTPEEQLHKEKFPKLYEELNKQFPNVNTARQSFQEVNQGKEFTMNVNGAQRTGTIEQEGDKLYFKYGNTQTEISNQDFKDGTIQEEIEDPANFLGFADPNAEGLPQARLLSNVQTLLDLNQEELQANRDTIEGLTQELKEIEEQLKDQEVPKNTQTKRNVRYSIQTIIRNATQLSERRAQIQEQINTLNSQSIELENVISEFQSILNNPPRNLEHQTDLLSQQVESLGQQVLNNGILVNAYTKLTTSISDLLNRLGKKIISALYSKNRELAGQPAFQTLRTAAETYEQSNSPEDFNRLLEIATNQASLIERFIDRPLTQGEIEIIKKQIPKIQDTLSELETAIRAKQEVIDQLQLINKDIDRRQELFQENKPEEFIVKSEVVKPRDTPATEVKKTQRKKVRVVQNGENYDLVDGSNKVIETNLTPAVAEQKLTETNQQVEEEVNTLVAEQEAPVEEAYDPNDDRIPLQRLFSATALPSPKDRTSGWYPQFLNLMSKLGSFTKDKRSNIKFITVTRTNEPEELRGLIDKVNTDSTGKVYVPQNTDDDFITLVAVEYNADGTFNYLDSNGSPVTEDLLNKVVITKMRAASISYKANGQANYSQGTPEQAQAELERYQKERAQIVNSPVSRTFRFRSSQGRESNEPVQISGNLVSPETIKETKVLKIVDSKDTVKRQKTISNEQGDKLVVKTGEVIIESEDVFQKVYSSPIVEAQGTKIVRTLQYLAEQIEKSKSQELSKDQVNKITQLANYVIGTVRVDITKGNYSTIEFPNGKTITLDAKTLSTAEAVTQFLDNLPKEKYKHFKEAQPVGNVNKTLLEKNKPFTEVIGFEQGGEPLLKVWGSYQEYLLSTQDGRTPLLQAYKTQDKYAILMENTTTETSRRGPEPSKEKTPRATKTTSTTKKGEVKNIQPGDQVTYQGIKATTLKGKNLQLTGIFTITGINIPETILAIPGERTQFVKIPKGSMSVKDEDGITFFLSPSTHNKTSNKKSYSKDTITPNWSEEGVRQATAEEIAETNKIMEAPTDIVSEVVAVIDQSQSVKEGVAIVEPKVRTETTPAVKKVQEAIVKIIKPQAGTLNEGDTITIQAGTIPQGYNTPEKYTTTYEIGKINKDGRMTYTRTLFNEDGSIQRGPEEGISKKGSAVEKLLLQEKNKNITPTETVLEITPIC